MTIPRPMLAVLRFAGLCGGLLLLATCSAHRPSGHGPSIEQQARILVRDVSFMHDTIPLLRFEAPPIYAMWRAEVEQCSGLHRDGVPTFWIAPRSLMPNEWLGMYVRQQRRVVFALGAETVSWIVRHELLHYLVDLPGHPAAFFGDTVSLGLCGHLVRPVREA